MPRSAIAATAAGLTSSPGSEPPDLAIAGSGGVVLEEAECHLRTPCVVHAEEQHDRLAVVGVALYAGQRGQPLPGEPLGEQGRKVVTWARGANWSYDEVRNLLIVSTLNVPPNYRCSLAAAIRSASC